MAPTMKERFWAKVQKTATCWLWTASTFRDEKTGLPKYGQFQLDGRPHVAHRVAWRLTFGDIPQGAMVLHRCDNMRCVRPDHLFLGTALDNMRDKVAKGRSSCGARNGRARLTLAQVTAIRAAHANGVKVRTLAKDHGVGMSTVVGVVKNQTWREAHGQ